MSQSLLAATTRDGDDLFFCIFDAVSSPVVAFKGTVSSVISKLVQCG